jgi:outer membrane protein OmpA-like peptidoglycan-associated protein
MKKSAYSLLATAFCLNSCMTYDPYTDEQKVSDSTKGAIIGGVAGAVLGNQVKGSRHVRNNAQIAGATIGALAGASIGNQMDKKEAALRHKLKNSGVSISRSGNQIILNTPGNITFDSGSAVINPEFEEILDSIALVLKEYKDSGVEVRGHCDDRGSIEANQILSQQRANAVASYLRVKGVKGSRINAVGYGKSSQASSDRGQNRRVEILISN